MRGIGALVLMLAASLIHPDILFAAHTAPGAFYAVISHGVMVWTAGLTFGFGVAAKRTSEGEG